MNLHKRCVRSHCRDYFPAKPLEFKFFCDKKECQEYFTKYHFYSMKSSRHISAAYFDLFDFDRPILTDGGKVIGYERVCRICGGPLLKKDGKYSHHKRYCNEHNGSELWTKYNWGVVSKDYAIKIREENQDLIRQKFNEQIQEAYQNYKKIPKWVKETTNLTICEVCGKLCQIYSQTFLYNNLGLKTINIHHKIPVHTLTNENFHLIWDESNLIALCEDCHHKQDHQLKSLNQLKVQFQKITNFI